MTLLAEMPVDAVQELPVWQLLSLAQPTLLEVELRMKESKLKRERSAVQREVEMDRVYATNELLRRFAECENKCADEALLAFVHSIGRQVCGSRDPERELRKLMGKDKKRGRPKNVSRNHQVAKKVRLEEYNGKSRENAIAKVAGCTEKERQVRRIYENNCTIGRANAALSVIHAPKKSTK